jgi:hypothetical protein
MMIAPVDSNHCKAQYITDKNRYEWFDSRPISAIGVFNSSTMIVIIIANTPSLNASNLVFVMQVAL